MAAAVAMGPGYAEVPLPLGGERPKSSESFWPGEKEARRSDVAVGVGGGEFSLLDIENVPGVVVLIKGSNNCQSEESSRQPLCSLGRFNSTAGRKWGEMG